jgi:glycosyltransferase involved in cell wall biosynthesis
VALTVGVDATAAARQTAGIGRYTRQLLGALAVRGDVDFRLFYCAPNSTAARLPALPASTRIRALPLSDRVTNAIWHRARLPIPVESFLGRLDLFHSPDFTLPPVLAPSVVTVHDLAFLTVPECAYPTLRAYLETVVPRSARNADHIIAVSHSTRRDVINRFGIAPEKVTTVYEAAGPEFYPETAERVELSLHEIGVVRPYILTVGTLEPRKNYERLLDAYSRMLERGAHQDLIVAGRPGWMFQPMLDRITSLGISDRVRIVQPDDALLRALYSGADAFVYPSLYEGFGIPVLEALACGAPVACSNTSSLPEVLGDAGLGFDPRSVEEIEHAVLRLLGDIDLQMSLRLRGPQRASIFSWQRAAEETAAVYRETVHG